MLKHVYQLITSHHAKCGWNVKHSHWSDHFYIDQWRGCDINVYLFCLDDFRVKSSFRTVYVLLTKIHLQNAQRRRVNFLYFLSYMHLKNASNMI